MASISAPNFVTILMAVIYYLSIIGNCAKHGPTREASFSGGSSGSGGAGRYSCKSPSGQNVDWFVAYKLPMMEGAARGTMLNKGTAFLYADSQNPQQWVLSEKGIDMKDSAIGMTVNQLFLAKRNKQHLYALYNDEHPNGPADSKRAHMKGILVFDENQGFWLVHSVPNFPSTQLGSYHYPFTGKKFGQSFLCITTPSSSLNDIGKQLYNSQPSWFEKQLPASLSEHYPMLAKAMSGKAPRKGSSELSSIMQLRSIGGQSFTSFAKHKKWGKDLYNDMVAPELHTSLYVETWLNGGGDLPSECATPDKVYNLRSVKPSNYKFPNAKDHSKWAVSGEGSTPWTCIGDINRQKSQEHRGGGTVCLNDARIAALYRQAMGDIEDCGNSSLSVGIESASSLGCNNTLRLNDGAEPSNCTTTRSHFVNSNRRSWLGHETVKKKKGSGSGFIHKTWKSVKKIIISEF